MYQNKYDGSFMKLCIILWLLIYIREYIFETFLNFSYDGT